MHVATQFFFLFLSIYSALLVSCPLCLSLPKNTNRPFFIDENSDYIEQSINFPSSNDSVSATNDTMQTLNNQ